MYEISKVKSPSSQRYLPSLKLPISPKALKHNSSELCLSATINSSPLILDLERRLLEQRKELMNRDLAVKKIIFNFEAILDAHNVEKNKNVKIQEKYLERQKEVIELKKINSQLSELISPGLQKVDQFEEEYKAELDELTETIAEK